MSAVDWYVLAFFVMWAALGLVLWFFTTVCGAILADDIDTGRWEFRFKTKAWMWATVLSIEVIVLGAFTVGMLVGGK